MIYSMILYSNLLRVEVLVLDIAVLTSCTELQSAMRMSAHAGVRMNAGLFACSVCGNSMVQQAEETIGVP